MNVVAFAEGQPNRQTRVNANGSTIPYVEVASLEVACDSSGFFLCEGSRSLVRAERT